MNVLLLKRHNIIPSVAPYSALQLREYDLFLSTVYYLYHCILSIRLIRSRSTRFIINSKTINTKYLALI